MCKITWFILSHRPFSSASGTLVTRFLFLPVSVSVAWFAFTVCMSAGVSTLNNYTKNVLMVGPRHSSSLNACSFNFVGLLPPYYTAGHPGTALTCPPSPPRISHLSPYYEAPAGIKRASSWRPAHFPPPTSRPAPASPFHRFSLPSPSPSLPPFLSVHVPLPGHHQNRYGPEEDYSPL